MGDGSGGCLQRSVSVPVTGGDGWSFGFRIAGGGRASIGRCRDPDAPVGPAAGEDFLEASSKAATSSAAEMAFCEGARFLRLALIYLVNN